MVRRIDALLPQGQPQKVESILLAAVVDDRQAHRERTAGWEVAVDPVNTLKSWEVTAAPVPVQSRASTELQIGICAALSQPRNMDLDRDRAVDRCQRTCDLDGHGAKMVRKPPAGPTPVPPRMSPRLRRPLHILATRMDANCRLSLT